MAVSFCVHAVYGGAQSRASYGNANVPGKGLAGPLLLRLLSGTIVMSSVDTVAGNGWARREEAKSEGRSEAMPGISGERCLTSIFLLRVSPTSRQTRLIFREGGDKSIQSRAILV